MSSKQKPSSPPKRRKGNKTPHAERRATAIAAVQGRMEVRKKKVVEEQRKMLLPKLAAKEWQQIKIKSGGKEGVQTELTCKGVCLYELKDAKGVQVELRFFPYNMIDGKFIHRDLGVLTEEDDHLNGEMVCQHAGKLRISFKNGAKWFGTKNIEFRYVHASELPSETLKAQQFSYAPQDVWWVRRDPATKRVYYMNKAMRKTSWTLPPGAHLANGKFAKNFKQDGGDGEGEEAPRVHGNEYQQKMNSISHGATKADLPEPLKGWFLKSNRKGKLQPRFLFLERQYLHYYTSERECKNKDDCKPPMDMYSIIGTKVPSENLGFEDHAMNDVHDCPFDIFTREKALALVPDQRWLPAKVIKKNSDDTYEVEFDNGDPVHKVNGADLRMKDEKQEARRLTLSVSEQGSMFKKGDKVTKQKDIVGARHLARVLKTWKPRILSGWFIKVNRKGRQQRRWLQLLGSKLSYFKTPHDTMKKQPINLEMLDSIKNPSDRLDNASGLQAFDLILAQSKNKVPQTLEEKAQAEEEDRRLEEKGVTEDKQFFDTFTLYPSQQDPATENLMQVLLDWQTHDELRFNINKFTLLRCKIKAHPATAFGIIVTDVEPTAVKTGFRGHEHKGVRITQLLSLPSGEFGPAENAGVMLNDTIVDIDGTKILRVQDAAVALKNKQEGIFTLCRLGEVNPEQMRKMKRSMMSKAEMEAEKVMDSVRSDVESRMADTARLEMARHKHPHRHHQGTKVLFGQLKVRDGWRSGTTPDGKAYWYHTNGKTSLKMPTQSEIIV